MLNQVELYLWASVCLYTRIGIQPATYPTRLIRPYHVDFRTAFFLRDGIGVFNELRFYVNGTLDGTLSVGSYGNISNGLPTAIAAAIAANGVEGTTSQFFPGGLDELRLSDIVRNVSWIKAYNER